MSGTEAAIHTYGATHAVAEAVDRAVVVDGRPPSPYGPVGAIRIAVIIAIASRSTAITRIVDGTGTMSGALAGACLDGQPSSRRPRRSHLKPPTPPEPAQSIGAVKPE
jgi:hypothetical protein